MVQQTKTAVVTGSSYGLGYSIVKLLLNAGFKVYGVSRSKSAITDPNFVWIQTDLMDSNSFTLIHKSIAEPKVDLLVNNAGVVFAEKSLEFSKEVFDKTFGVNLTAPIKLTSVLKKKLDGGVVVNISSTSDRFAEEGLGMYCASKAALSIYFDSVGIENPNIKILNILPVYIDTPMLEDIAKKLNFTTNDAVPADKVAEVVVNALADTRLESGSKLIVLSNKSMDNIEDPEKLWFYNVDTKEMKKLK